MKMMITKVASYVGHRDSLRLSETYSTGDRWVPKPNLIEQKKESEKMASLRHHGFSHRHCGLSFSNTPPMKAWPIVGTTISGLLISSSSRICLQAGTFKDTYAPTKDNSIDGISPELLTALVV